MSKATMSRWPTWVSFSSAWASESAEGLLTSLASIKPLSNSQLKKLQVMLNITENQLPDQPPSGTIPRAEVAAALESEAVILLTRLADSLAPNKVPSKLSKQRANLIYMLWERAVRTLKSILDRLEYGFYDKAIIWQSFFFHGKKGWTFYHGPRMIFRVACFTAEHPQKLLYSPYAQVSYAH